MKELLEGKPFKHPLHTALVHFPIALFSLSFLLDLASLLWPDAARFVPAAFYSLVSGVVRTTRLLSDGRRQVGDFYYPGDVIGLEVGETYRFSAEALTDCVVRVVKRSSLGALSGQDNLDRALWEATRRELERTQEHLLAA